MKQTKLRTLILAAMFAALTCVATMIIHIPSPIGGYFNLGDCMVLLSAFVLGPVWGTAAGGHRLRAGRRLLRLFRLRSRHTGHQSSDGARPPP